MSNPTVSATDLAGADAADRHTRTQPRSIIKQHLATNGCGSLEVLQAIGCQADHVKACYGHMADDKDIARMKKSIAAR